MLQVVKGFKKEDLKFVAKELGEKIPPKITVADLKKLIVDSKEYELDPDFLQRLVAASIEKRKRKLQQQREREIEVGDREKSRLEYEIELARIQAQKQGTTIKANENDTSFAVNNFLEVYNDYLIMEEQVKRLVDRGVKSLLPYALEVNQHVNITSTCRDNLFQLMNGIRKLTEWAINYLDSIGKPQSGMLLGNLQMFGEAEQCFDTVVKKKDKIVFRGQYCSVHMKPIIPPYETMYPTLQFKELRRLTQNSSGLLKIIVDKLSGLYYIDPKIGICVPSGCTKDDLSQLFNYLSIKTNYLNATVLSCVKKEDASYWIIDRIVSVCALAFLGMLVLTGTVFDHFVEESVKEKFGLLTKYLHCFSLIRNFPKLMNTDTNEGTITCFHGIRVLSMFWIILCHEYLLHGTGLISNHAWYGIEFISGFLNQIIINGFSSTEIFFLLGGFVNYYTRFKIKQSGMSQPSNLKIIIHRLWRLYPTIFVTILLFFLLSATNIVAYEGQMEIVNNCKKNLWKNILFINNYFDPVDVCLGQSWYLSVDLQLFLLSLITTPVLLRNEKLGEYLHTGMIFIASMGCFILWWIEDLPPSNIDPDKLSLSSAFKPSRVYASPLVHIATYNIGILLAHVVVSKKKMKFSKVGLLLGWLTASFFYLSVLFMTYRWYSGTPYTKIESSLYGSLSKPLLGLSISWMVYCCITGQASFVNYILSLKMWIPLSRLTYMLYMNSLQVQMYYTFNLNFPPDMKGLFVLWTYFGNLFVSILMCIPLVLAVESPFVAMEKILFKRNQEEKKSSPEIQIDATLNEKKDIILSENPKITTVEV